MVLLAGCSLLPGRQFAFSVPAEGARPAVPGILADTTGMVIKVDVVNDVAPPLDKGMMTSPADPNAVVVHWVGGACDERIQIDVLPEGGTTIQVATTTQPGPCELIGLSRAVRIEFAAPVDLSRTSVRFTP